MAGYEVVLRDGGHDEIRLIDQPLEVGQTVVLDGLKWLVVSAGPGQDPFRERRFVLTPSVALTDPARRSRS